MTALQLSRESKVVLPLSTVIDVRLEQPENGMPLVKPLPMVSEVSPLQFEKAPLPRVFTLSGMDRAVRPVQP